MYVFKVSGHKWSTMDGNLARDIQRATARIRSTRRFKRKIGLAWTITMVVTVAFIGVTIAHAPNAEDWPTWIVGVWTVWTVLWGIWSRKIWLGKRHVVTDDFLIVIVQRFPFEDPRSIRIPIADIQSATLTQSPVGWILRFCSLELDVKGSDDPAISILTYVHQGTRVDKNIEALRRREE